MQRFKLYQDEDKHVLHDAQEIYNITIDLMAQGFKNKINNEHENIPCKHIACRAGTSWRYVYNQL